MTGRLFTVEEGLLPSLPGMMLVTLRALRDMGGSATIQELDERVVALEGVTEAEQARVMSETDGRSRVAYDLSWSRTYLRCGGALANSARGV
ncbi:hypothetical protein JANAI62_08510 [Jannaschia pagri]|uniref:Restriction system protein Mrr-like N-terminal domain-containing protein n=1 Tax=Jannaschia pagri TaxID=2829797 RepID=A0ABQ4NIH9_9RHOB|nr:MULTISPECIES: winged helix-turn-helix domain-containing protein [unclassified Jannaschia]GIT94228.1 hypothetical protein JANAI62_08510 [Jannaschia sp. AI_62]